MSNQKFAYIDFEFNNVSEKNLNLVCCSILYDNSCRSYWLNSNEDLGKLKVDLEFLQINSYILVAYAAEAEASSLISIGVNPLKFKWVDLHLEVKMLYNHNFSLNTGKHLIGNREVNIKPFSTKANTSLVSSVYKFLGLKIDSEYKNSMRDIIIRSDYNEIESNKQKIMEYCDSDVKHLPSLFKAIYENLRKFIPKSNHSTLTDEILLRGEYSARTAIMVRHGIPINMEWANNLTGNIPSALIDCIQDINSQFPDIKPFNFDKKNSKYTLNTKSLKAWIKSQNIKSWMLTEGKDISLCLEAWEDHFYFRHDFPRFNFGAQMVRYLKLKQSLSSFNFKKDQKEKTFFDYIGKDGFNRPYMNHYGAQSSRTQAKSSGFLFLKSAWMRSMCQPPLGYSIGGIDYSSQEFLLGAVCSNDKKMIEAYREGDVYLYYGKGIGLIPKDGTKQTHGKERDLCKSTVLGLSYLMTKVGLSKKLTQDTGRIVSEEEADDLVNKFDALFSVFSEWRKEVIESYRTNKYLRLNDGWYMFGDNYNKYLNLNFRSIANVPLQGAGAVIMRKAVALAQDKNINVIMTLHDAIYIMSKDEDISSDMDILNSCMKEAFISYFEKSKKDSASIIRLDGKVWGSSFDDSEIITKNNFKIEASKFHIDKRSLSEYTRFNKFFTVPLSTELL